MGGGGAGDWLPLGRREVGLARGLATRIQKELALRRSWRPSRLFPQGGWLFAARVSLEELDDRLAGVDLAAHRAGPLGPFEWGARPRVPAAGHAVEHDLRAITARLVEIDLYLRTVRNAVGQHLDDRIIRALVQRRPGRDGLAH